MIFGFYSAVGNGKRTGNAVRSSIRCQTVAHARRVHATFMDHIECHVPFPATNLLVRNANLAVLWPEQGDCRARWDVLAVHDPSAVRIRIQLPLAEVLAGTEQGHGHGMGVCSGLGVSHLPELASDSAVESGLAWCSCFSQHLLVDCGLGAVPIYCDGLLPWCLDWF